MSNVPNEVSDPELTESPMEDPGAPAAQPGEDSAIIDGAGGDAPL